MLFLQPWGPQGGERFRGKAANDITHLVAGVREMDRLEGQVLSLYKNTCPRARDIKPIPRLYHTAECGHWGLRLLYDTYTCMASVREGKK